MLRSITTGMASNCVFYLTLCKHQKLNPIFFIGIKIHVCSRRSGYVFDVTDEFEKALIVQYGNGSLNVFLASAVMSERGKCHNLCLQRGSHQILS